METEFGKLLRPISVELLTQKEWVLVQDTGPVPDVPPFPFVATCLPGPCRSPVGTTIIDSSIDQEE